MALITLPTVNRDWFALAVVVWIIMLKTVQSVNGGELHMIVGYVILLGWLTGVFMGCIILYTLQIIIWGSVDCLNYIAISITNYFESLSYTCGGVNGATGDNHKDVKDHYNNNKGGEGKTEDYAVYHSVRFIPFTLIGTSKLWLTKQNSIWTSGSSITGTPSQSPPGSPHLVTPPDTPSYQVLPMITIDKAYSQWYAEAADEEHARELAEMEGMYQPFCL